MKSSLKIAGKAIFITVILTLVHCGLLVLAFCLPTAPMRQHLAESYPLIESEHQYLQWDQGYTSSMMDFWSEYTLYGAAINEDAKGNAFEKAMMMWYIDTPGVERDKAVLSYARNPEEAFELTAYPRYWNGIVIFMKLLLLKFTIPDIRMISMFFSFALLALTIVLMVRNNLVSELIPFMTALLFINPITMIYSLVYLSEFVPMLLGIDVMLCGWHKINDMEGGWCLFFAILGAVTSFYTFLSSPFIALGIPLIVLIWLTKEKNVIKKVISSSIYWFGAYIITWVMKWIICSIFTSYNLIADVFNRVDIYENNDNVENSGTTIMERLIHNLWAYKTPAFVLLFAIAVALIVIVAVIQYKKCGSKAIAVEAQLEKSSIIDALIGYSMIACIPIVIFVVLGNGYAYNHFFMAHRNLAITVLASLCIIKRAVDSVLKMIRNK